MMVTYVLQIPNDTRRMIKYTVETSTGYDPVLQKLLDMGFQLCSRYEHSTEKFTDMRGIPIGGFPL